MVIYLSGGNEMQLNVYMDKELADELKEAAARYTRRTGRFQTRQSMLKMAWNAYLLSKAGGAGLQGVVVANESAKKGAR
jgi:hypothetical protein